jgi:cyclophilin family peptidyl-prolyl cis-trans isomerase
VERKGEEKVTQQTDPAIQEVLDYISRMKKEGRIDTEGPNWKTRLPRFPKVSYTEGKAYAWNLLTNHGEVKIRFFPDVAPSHVTNFIYLTELGFFDGLTFHRVIPGFMAQGGDPLGVGTGGPGYQFPGEFREGVGHDRPGLLSMANAGPGTDGSQFFLTFVPLAYLDGKHTVFGEVVEGMEAVGELERRGSESGQTTEPLLIERARVTVEG